MTECATESKTKTLNVIFQGLIVFFQNRADTNGLRSITALIPNLGTDHAYRAGNWLSEISLAPGAYQLGKVDLDGDGDFCEKEHTILKGLNIRPVLSQHELCVSLQLPQPHHIASFRTVSIPRSAFVNPACLPCDMKCLNVAHTHIFTYKVSGHLHDVRLGDVNPDKNSTDIAAAHPWAPDADHCSEIANLHVLASPETRPRVPHHVDEFHLAASLLHDFELQLKENLPYLPPVPSQQEIDDRGVKGVIQAELEDLCSRNVRLGEMGRVIRRKIDAAGDDGLLDIGGIWSVIDELSEPLACTPPGAGS
jgi:hypothetical protein